MKRVVAVAMCAAFVVACGQPSPVATVASPTAGTPSAPTSSSPASSPVASPTHVGLVIVDYSHTQVRLALENATDIATVSGQFDGVAAGQALVVNGVNLMAISPAGAVRTLGHLAAQPSWTGPGSVAVNSDLTRWIYTVAVPPDLTSQIHLGTPNGDSVIATVPSPDGYDFYQAFAWNGSGAYLIKQGTGLGGVGPFLEYHFPLARLDVSSGKITAVSPACTVETVLDDGTLLCRNTTGGLEVRSPSGSAHTIQLAQGSSGTDAAYSRLTLTADGSRLFASRNGSSDPSLINYQIAAAGLTSTTAAPFGPIDFVPDVQLPDGRLVADHLCWTFQGNGGPCDQSLDGTYFISADGQSRTLFYKLAQSSSVAGAIWS